MRLVIKLLGIAALLSGCHAQLIGAETTAQTGGTSTPTGTAQIATVQLSGDQLTLSGSGLSAVSSVQISGPGLVGTQSLAITSQSPSSLVLSAASQLKLSLGTAYNLLVSSAGADSPLAVVFQVQNGSIGPAQLDRAYVAKAGDAMTGSLTVAQAPAATANSGLLNLGNGPFDGSSFGFFAGSANGTVIAANVASTFSGNLVDIQVAGQPVLRVDQWGDLSSGDVWSYYWTNVPYSPSGSSASVPTPNHNEIHNTAVMDSALTATVLSSQNAVGNIQNAYIGTVSNTGGANYSPSLVFGIQTGANSYSEIMRVDQTGNVGIGTASPQTVLDVSGGDLSIDGTASHIDASLFITGYGDSPRSGLWLESHNSDAVGIIGDATSLVIGVDGFRQNDGQTIQFQGAGTTVMTIEEGGNVGIGTTNPGALLDVKGHIANSATGTPSLSSCGSSTITGNDTRGTIALDIAPSCTVSFATPYTSTPVCVVSVIGDSGATVALSAPASSSGFTVATTGGPTGITYICMQ